MEIAPVLRRAGYGAEAGPAQRRRRMAGGDKKSSRCWPGYEPVPGKGEHEEGSCRPMAKGKNNGKKPNRERSRKEQVAEGGERAKQAKAKSPSANERRSVSKTAGKKVAAKKVAAKKAAGKKSATKKAAAKKSAIKKAATKKAAGKKSSTKKSADSKVR